MRCFVEDARIEDTVRDYIIEHFEWEDVLAMMQAVDWTYGEGEPVTLESVKKMGERLLREVVVEGKKSKHPVSIVSSGGFEARYERGQWLSLVFAPYEMPYGADIKDIANESFVEKKIIGKTIEEVEDILSDYNIRYTLWEDGDEYPEPGVMAIILEPNNSIKVQDAWIYFED